MAEPNSIEVSVVIPAHNPDIGRLLETLRGLRGQSLPTGRWETLLVDNASAAFPLESAYAEAAPANLRLMSEPRLGLTSARLAGIRGARGAAIVLVDDDNVLDPGYLAEAVRLFARSPRLGAAGGKSLPTFEAPPAPWLGEFLALLAIRDLGEAEILAASFRPEGSVRNEYPACAPIGAGMALRREAALAWADSVEHDPKRRRLDRSGLELVSGGDNDIVMTLLERGWSVGYFPSLILHHLIPKSRLDAHYVARLNRAIQRSWVQVLALHGANPWQPIPASTVPLRKLKAWFTRRAWKGPAERIRWQGACGHFEGRAT
jgi:glycosyltransferase involved in cell wall biosynthesis